MSAKFDVTVIRSLLQIVRQENYKLIHTHTPRSALVGSILSLITKLPMVHHVHSPTLADTENPFRNRLNYFFEKIAIQKAATLVAVSGSLRDYLLIMGFDSRKIEVVHNGVACCNSFIEKNMTEGEVILGCVGYFRPRKGLEVAIESLAKLRQLGVACRLRLIGAFESASYEEQVRELTHEKKVAEHIDWVGFSDDVYRELAQLDIFVLPSLYGEGLPMVVLEAMATGLPIVATKVEGVPEAVRHGVDGLLVNPGDPAELTGAIHDIVKGCYCWEEMRRHAYERHRDNFSDLRMAEDVAAIYDTVL